MEFNIEHEDFQPSRFKIKLSLAKFVDTKSRRVKVDRIRNSNSSFIKPFSFLFYALGDVIISKIDSEHDVSYQTFKQQIKSIKSRSIQLRICLPKHFLVPVCPRLANKSLAITECMLIYFGIYLKKALRLFLYMYINT